MHESVEPSAVSRTCSPTNVAAPAPIASSCRRYGSGSRRGYSMLAMTSAACASAMPGALDAAVSASTRSFFMQVFSYTLYYLYSTPSSHQFIEQRDRQRRQSVDDELRAGELGCRIPGGNSHTA